VLRKRAVRGSQTVVNLPLFREPTIHARNRHDVSQCADLGRVSGMMMRSGAI